MAQPLTRRERDMLAFERHFPDGGGQGVKDALAAKLWPDLSGVRYAQVLAALIGRAEAEAAAPAVVRRLRGVGSLRRRNTSLR